GTLGTGRNVRRRAGGSVVDRSAYGVAAGAAIRGSRRGVDGGLSRGRGAAPAAGGRALAGRGNPGRFPRTILLPLRAEYRLPRGTGTRRRGLRGVGRHRDSGAGADAVRQARAPRWGSGPALRWPLLVRPAAPRVSRICRE